MVKQQRFITLEDLVKQKGNLFQKHEDGDEPEEKIY